MKTQESSILILLLVLQFVQIGYLQSKTYTIYEWEIEPNLDGSAHIEITITLGYWSSEISHTYSNSRPVVIESIRAWETASGAAIKVETADQGDSLKIVFKFGEKKEPGYQFTVEYDRLKKVEEKYEEVFYFDMAFGGEIQHSATITLPVGHELLYATYLDPIEVSADANHVLVKFRKPDPEEEWFRCGVMFSKKGIQLLNNAENRFNRGQYEEAEDAYEVAIEFYSQFSELYGRDKDEFLAELEEKVTECKNLAEKERIERNTQIAEEKFEEALAAFNNEDYRSATVLFKEAQSKYNSVSDSEKASECQNYIDKCTEYLEKIQSRANAETLLDEGIAHFRQGQYEEAKTKFQEALTIFTELNDEEKIQDCKEWIASCEEAMKPPEEEGGFCLGTILLVTLIGIGLIVSRRSR
jgi:tetratricopeptide (TPR) repeat protein